MKLPVSVVIVKYKSEKYFSGCLASVEKENPLEIIVIDNDKDNIGYGAACNLGAKKAKGDYILFLNPDTIVLPRSIKLLSDYLVNNKEVGIVGPKLFRDKEKQYHQLSACKFPDILTALIVYGKFNKIWPNNPIWNEFVYKNQQKLKQPIEVDVVSGAALMVRSRVFNQVEGFDPWFFLYFEENDLCRRVKLLGYKVVYNPNSHIIHFGGGSTITGKNIDKTFSESRRRFFEKHYSKQSAAVVNFLLNL